MMVQEAVAIAVVGMALGITVGAIVGNYITDAIMGVVKQRKRPKK